jgi:asparagine synthetase B (glutamine-hydrolysing)
MFGGYGRHETRTRNQGLDGLRSEMVLDLSRLWKRNLGRDDRVLADHARDTRHPFLDEAIVDWVAHANVESMISKNGSNKPVLRQLAREFLGMCTAANFRKRAIQFGTRLAQQTNIKCFGSHSRGSGTVEYSRILEQN